jgi:predicted secreted hydrolase
VIHYVQRPRLDLVGLLRRRGDDAPRVLTGDATQDRHWMTMTNPALRWLWLMARLPDGRDVMAFEMRSADGGRHAPADAGRPAGGGAWLVETDGRVRAIASWSLRPEAHVDTPRGRVPRRFRVRLQDDGLDVRLVLRHRQPTFVPTRALGELYDAGIWESPCDVESAEGVGEGGRYWVDVMTPGGGV